jgi:hypothetical protein
MKIRIDYPVNGQDLSVDIVGDTVGINIVNGLEVVAWLKNVEVFRYSGEQRGLLANTEIAKDIMYVAKVILLDLDILKLYDLTRL